MVKLTTLRQEILKECEVLIKKGMNEDAAFGFYMSSTFVAALWFDGHVDVYETPLASGIDTQPHGFNISAERKEISPEVFVKKQAEGAY